jgi:hypothetical protein
LHTPHGIVANASCERRCALRALLVLLLGVAMFYPFYLSVVNSIQFLPICKKKIVISGYPSSSVTARR